MSTQTINPPTNYRKHLFTLSGKTIYCGAMARPNTAQVPSQAEVYSLFKTARQRDYYRSS